jgi:hypothetical protein
VSGVSCSRALKWFVALVLVLTLGWKWADSAFAPTPSLIEAEEKSAEFKVTQFLLRNHFRVEESREVVFGMQLLVVTSVLCKMNVVLSSSRGWHRDLIGNLSAGSAQSFVVFAGEIYPEQPMLRTIPDFLVARFLTGLGFRVRPTPVITVIAGPNCDADRLPWRDMR